MVDGKRGVYLDISLMRCDVCIKGKGFRSDNDKLEYVVLHNQCEVYWNVLGAGDE